MKISEFLKYYPDYNYTEDQLSYCLFLESKGLTFLVDFGFKNAEDIVFSGVVSKQ